LIFPGHFWRKKTSDVCYVAQAFVDVEDLDIYTEYEAIAKWHPASRVEGESIYGAERLQEGWSQMLTKLRSIYEKAHGDLYCDKLPQIRCKTLVVAGAQDRLVPDFHSEYLSERIMHCRLHVFPRGRHDVHLHDAAAFNDLLRTFLTEEDDKQTQSREYVARPM
jgi:valacyclovir hydrolase